MGKHSLKAHSTTYMVGLLLFMLLPLLLLLPRPLLLLPLLPARPCQQGCPI
jgi:hypothetical protein